MRLPVPTLRPILAAARHPYRPTWKRAPRRPRAQVDLVHLTGPHTGGRGLAGGPDPHCPPLTSPSGADAAPANRLWAATAPAGRRKAVQDPHNGWSEGWMRLCAGVG